MNLKKTFFSFPRVPFLTMQNETQRSRSGSHFLCEHQKSRHIPSEFSVYCLQLKKQNAKVNLAKDIDVFFITRCRFMHRIGLRNACKCVVNFVDTD